MSDKMLVKELLLSNNYWVLNKTIVKMFGVETAFLLTNLAEAEQIMSTEDGWFYQTSDTLEELTTLSRYKQDNAIEQLENAGVLKKDVRGIPAKRYFKLDYKVLANKIVNNSQTSIQKTDKLVCKKLATNKEHTIKKVDIESSINHSTAEAERIPYKEIVNYLNEKTGSAYKPTTPSTKKLIQSRMREGFTEDDFYKVIDIKTSEWIKDSKMKAYLRPQTLFGTKFESYLNQDSGAAYSEVDKRLEETAKGWNF